MLNISLSLKETEPLFGTLVLFDFLVPCDHSCLALTVTKVVSLNLLNIMQYLTRLDEVVAIDPLMHCRSSCVCVKCTGTNLWQTAAIVQ